MAKESAKDKRAVDEQQHDTHQRLFVKPSVSSRLEWNDIGNDKW